MSVCFLNGRLSQQYRVVVVLPFRDAMVKFSKGLPQSFKHTTTRQIASADESVTSDARALPPPTSPPLYSYVIGRYPPNTSNTPTMKPTQALMGGGAKVPYV
jgi:hypothetical protein